MRVKVRAFSGLKNETWGTRRRVNLSSRIESEPERGAKSVHPPE